MNDEIICGKSGCGIAFEYEGRGRRPKYCPSHREAPRNVDKVKPTSRKTSSKSLDVLRLELTQTLQGAGAMLMAVDQFDGMVIISGTPRLVDALISMAEVDPSFRKFLESGTKSIVWLQLGTAVAAIAVPIAARHRVIPIDPKGAYQLFHGKLPASFNEQPKPKKTRETEPQQPETDVMDDDVMPGDVA